jgi:hypothetical protein
VDAKRKALLVTCAAYEEPGLRQLRAPVHDAKALERVLADSEVGDFDVTVVRDEKHYVITKHIADFFAQCGPDDLLLVYISGHGIKDDDGHLHFASRNTELTSLDATAVSADFVNRQMKRTRSRRVVLILDCCYAGAFARGMIPRADQTIHLREQFEGSGRVVLTASKATEYAFEGDQLISGEERPSVFTGALVRGLATGQADRDADGWISFDDLYDYLSIEVPKETPKQTPTRWVFDAVGELHIARSRRGALAPISGHLPAAATGLHETVITSSVGKAVGRASAELAQRRRFLSGGKWVPSAVHEAAIEAAVNSTLEVQTALTKTMSDASINLARRFQTLLERQLEVINELEHKETSSQEQGSLHELDRLDRLAARMRRCSENLIMLAGGVPLRRFDRSVPLQEVIRSAIKEVGDYERVEVEVLALAGTRSINEVDLAGVAVGDVVHLLAELIENATSFSPPDTKVQIAGQELRTGYVIEIEDRGLGMSDAELIEANERLANPPEIDAAVSRMLGLFVAGRLAKRYGIRIQLRHSWYGGVTALVLLPTNLIVNGQEPRLEGQQER